MVEISIIVPVYNVEEYLEKCIESILNQTFKNFELILVDDGSTDKSGKICDKYEKIDNRIKVIHKNNEGQSSARNAGLDIACGKYIGFVDSDDSIHPRMYEILYDLIQNHNADISCCNYRETYKTINKDYEEISLDKIIKMDNIQAVNSLYDKDIGIRLVVAWNKLYNRDLFNDTRYEVGKIHEDEYIAHRLLYKCKKVVYLNAELYYYLQREGSIMSQTSYKRKVDRLLAHSDRMKFCNKMGLKDLCYFTSQIYRCNFFSLYREIDTNYEIELRELLRRDFIQSLNILLKIKDACIKEKISWLIFVISPNIYNLYFNKYRLKYK